MARTPPTMSGSAPPDPPGAKEEPPGAEEPETETFANPTLEDPFKVAETRTMSCPLVPPASKASVEGSNCGLRCPSVPIRLQA